MPTILTPAAHDAPLRVRRATPRDLAALVALENASFLHDRMSTRQWRRHLANAGADVLVAARGAEPVGAAVVFHRRGLSVARLYSISVAASERGRGTGAVLLAACERAARRRGCDRLRLEVRIDNAPAQRLYERAGYALFGRRPDYYADGATALRYEKPLRGAARSGPARP